MSDHDDTRRVILGTPRPQTADDNAGTIKGVCAPRIDAPDGPADLGAVREALAKHARQDAGPALMLMALAPSGDIAGVLWLAATDQLRSATVGHHSSVDLYLPDYGGLSLRHFVVLVRGVEGRVSWRVLDLRTPDGLVASDATPLRSFTGDGPTRFVAGAYLFVLVPVGVPDQWTAAGPDAWQQFPSSQYLTQTADLREPAARARIMRDGADQTLVFVRRGVTEAVGKGLLASGELPEGVLEITHRRARASLAVGEAALNDGVLLGRYPRCDLAELSSRDRLSRVSRVHALIVRDQAGIYILDTGSVAGVRRDGQAVQVERLIDGATYELADVHVCWQSMDPKALAGAAADVLN